MTLPDRNDPTDGRARHRRVTSSALAALAVLAGAITIACATPSTPAQAAVADEAVILVHGWYLYWQGPGNTWKTMDAMGKKFRDRGYPEITVQLTSNDNLRSADEIAQAVATAQHDHPNKKVHLVAHSMGAISARWYLKVRDNGANLDKVSSFTSIGGANYGTDQLCASYDYPPNSPAAGQACPGSPLLTTLNAGPDTPRTTVVAAPTPPGDILYTTMWSTSADKAANAELKGGACFVPFAGVNHGDEPTDDHVFDLALQTVQGICPGTQEIHPDA